MPYRLKNIQQLCTAKYITKTIDSEEMIQHLQLAKQKKVMLYIDHRLHAVLAAQLQGVQGGTCTYS